jgi:hypothetical protein
LLHIGFVFGIKHRNNLIVRGFLFGHNQFRGIKHDRIITLQRTVP